MESDDLTVGDPARWRAPVQCQGTSSASAVPGSTPAPAVKPRESEAGILVQAYSDANASLEQSHGSVRPACDEMVDAYWQAEASLDRYDKYASANHTKHAHEGLQLVARRHAEDGPEDRRHQPKWLSPWLIWPVFFASAIYDTVFIGDILQQMIDASPGSFSYYAAYFPGLGIMVGLLVTAYLLGTAHVRRRVRLERRRLRTLPWGKQERDKDDLPWPMWTFAILFGIFVIGTLWVWALIRAKLGAVAETGWNLSNYHLHSAVLLLLLSVAAVAMRVISHNPYAISDKAAKAEAAKVRAEAEELRRDATGRITRHAQSWVRLQAVLAVAVSQAQRFVEAGRAQILELRAERANAGKPMQDTMTPMTLGLWRVDNEGEISSGPQTVDLAGELRLHREVLEYAEDIAKRLTTQKLEARLEEIDDKIRIQLSDGEPDSSESRTHEGSA